MHGDGDYLGNDHILSAAYGFGCAGGSVTKRLLARHGSVCSQKHLLTWHGLWGLRISLTSWKKAKKRVSA